MNLSHDHMVRTLREQPVTTPDGGQATLDRVLRALDQRTRLRARRRVQYAALIAAMLTLTALAQVLRTPAPAPQQAPSRTVLPEASLRAPEAPQTPASAPQPAEGAESAPPPSLGAQPRVAATAPRRARVTPQRAPAPPAPETASSAEVLAVLYATAHRLHFSAPADTALAAWDAYLAAHPTGPLAIEANYNRAVALLRVGRTEAAREAFAPFARGDFGAFRQRDALRWLRTLDHTP